FFGRNLIGSNDGTECFVTAQNRGARANHISTNVRQQPAFADRLHTFAWFLCHVGLIAGAASNLAVGADPALAERETNMGTTQGTTDTSPRFVARITGLFYLLTIVTGLFAQGFVSERLVVFSDPAA